MLRSLIVSCGLLCLVPHSTSAPPQADVKRQLKSKDVFERLSAIQEIRATNPEDGEKLLLPLLKDRDWQVVEDTATALGVCGGEDAIEELAELARTGYTFRLRRAATQALVKLDPEGAIEKVAKELRRTPLRAAQAHAWMAMAAKEPSEEAIQDDLSSQDGKIRAEAARALGAVSLSLRKSAIEDAMERRDVEVAANGLSSLAKKPHRENLTMMVSWLGSENLTQTMRRRLIAALDTTLALAKTPDEALEWAKGPLDELDTQDTATALRTTWLLDRLIQNEPGKDVKGVFPLDQIVSRLLPFLSHKAEPVRRAAAHALGKTKIEQAFDAIATAAKTDDSPKVRATALRSLASHRDATNASTRSVLIDRLSADDDASVRIEAAVFLGALGVQDVVAPLTQALQDPEWTVSVCAAVSLGKTGLKEAIAPLEALGEDQDWRKKGAALVGFGLLQQPEGIPFLIDGLKSKRPALKMTAYNFLKRLNAKRLPPKSTSWKSWWKKNEAEIKFRDPEVRAREIARYGASSTTRATYQDLDIIVYENPKGSLGDHIETLLGKLDIEHRMTRQGKLAEAGVHPHAIFVSNCSGEMDAEDIEELKWFVHTGGYLFGSCWALTETIQRIVPGFVRMLPTRNQVLDVVSAEPSPNRSPFLTSVFDGISRPQFVLEGAHIIDVLWPERVEVLIDSPQCEQRWGGGNLACWFTLGHGLILDSTNHFDLQGFARAPDLEKPPQRMAYAMDHMGLNYEDLREFRKKRVFEKPKLMEKMVHDLTIFKFITNFVRQKRRSDL